MEDPRTNVTKHIALTAVSCAVLLLSMVSCSRESAAPADPAPDTGTETAPDAPIINAHMHSAYLGMDDADYLQDVLKEMDDNGVQLAVLHLNEPGDIEDWINAAPGRFLAGPVFPCFVENTQGARSCVWDQGDWPSVEWLRERYADGTFSIMGEMLFVYAGIAPDDPRMSAYWALAAEFDVPVFVHINRGPPPDSMARPTGCCPDFDPDLGNPELLRTVLTQYPQLRVVLQHTGFPAMPEFDGIDYLDETYAILGDFPNVYVDLTALNAAAPPEVHEAALIDLIERGFGDRILFGSDNWEMAPILKRYESFASISEADRRNIFFENAHRFLRLDDRVLGDGRHSAPGASQ